MNAEDDDLVEPASAIELAIATSSKHFIASYMVQNVVNDIYTGRVVYNVRSTRSLVADNYKRRTIQFYDPKHAPFLDHYRYVAHLRVFSLGLNLVRLRVPRVSTSLAPPFLSSRQAVWGHSRFHELFDPPSNVSLMLVESVLMSLALKFSDHTTQTRSTQASTSMNLASEIFGAQENTLTTQSYSLHRLYLCICSW